MLFILITARMPSCTSWVTRSRPCTCKRTLFTSKAIAKALIDTEERGVKVVAILKASNQTKRYSAADFLAHEGIETYIDSQHGIAHNKIIIIDRRDGFNPLVQLHQSRRGK
jgi:phosphatidylserine/phosphatidylglycerophosphate/cardiolipin synthase-like enzyme